MIHKKLLSLLVLLMTAASGAWATVYNSGEVNSADLKVGDILYDVTIGNRFKLAANRYKDQNGVQNANSDPLVNIVIDADGLLYKKFRPVTADGQDGNAWVVTEKMSMSPSSGEVQVLLGGIIYDADSIYLATDAAKESDPFTEATFTMPASDATVDYELVRDMSVQMTTKVGDGAEGADYRIRLKKKDSKWELADLNVQQVKALFKVHDAIENKDLAFSGDSAGDAKKVLFLTSGNKLQFPEALPADFKGFRAYFLLKGEAAAARSFLLNLGEGETGETGETTSLKNNEQRIKNNEAGAWYDLQGRRVNGAARKGVYVVNGKKVVIK